MGDEVHGAGVDEDVLELDVGVVGGELGRDLAPEAAGVEDVGLVDARELAAPAAGELEAGAEDAFDLALAVTHGVDGLAPAGVLPALLGLAEVDSAGELADDDHVDPFEHLALHGAVAEEEGVDAHGADVGEEAEALAQAEDGLLGANGGLGIVPLGAAHGAEKNGAGAGGGLERVVTEGDAVLVDGGAADDGVPVLELVAETALDGVQHLQSFFENLGADAVSGCEEDRVGRHASSVPARSFRGPRRRCGGGKRRGGWPRPRGSRDGAWGVARR